MSTSQHVYGQRRLSALPFDTPIDLFSIDRHPLPSSQASVLAGTRRGL
ncbi:hypothetical protein ABZ502_16835 [Streptomyces abikoensis]